MARPAKKTRTAKPKKTKKPAGTALDRSEAYLNKIFKTTDAGKWGSVAADPNIYKKSLPHMPTGSLVLDYLIGGELNEHGVPPCPGFPRGRIVQIWGHESSGKTTVALTAAATTIANGGTVGYIDFEHEMVPSYAKALGCPIEKPSLFRLVQPDTMEDGFKVIKVMILSGVDMIIVDSVGAGAPTLMATQDIAEIGVKVVGVGLVARGWNDFWNANKPLLTKSGTCFVALSQMRSIIGANMPGQKKTKPQGGNVWKFISSIRIELSRIGTEKATLYNALTHKSEKRVMVGKIRAKIVKSKLSMSAGHEQLFYIRWGSGIDDVRSLLEIAISHHIIKKSGAWFSWKRPDGTEVRGQGKDQMRFKIIADDGLVDDLYAAVLPHLTAQTPDEDLYDESIEDDYADEGVDAALAHLELEKMVENADSERAATDAKADGFEVEDNA